MTRLTRLSFCIADGSGAAGAGVELVVSRVPAAETSRRVSLEKRRGTEAGGAKAEGRGERKTGRRKRKGKGRLGKQDRGRRGKRVKKRGRLVS